MIAGMFRTPPMDRVIYGHDFAEAAAAEAERLGARRVLVLAGSTLARQTDLLARLEAALGARHAASLTGIAAHTPRADVLRAAVAARAAGADLLMTLGGGSVTDTAKMVALALGNGVERLEDFDRLRAEIRADGSTYRPEVAAPPIRTVCIPVTLSAGEYTHFAGCTDPLRGHKDSYAHPLMMPVSVILDPAAARFTPEWLFLSTGIRAVDHAVEDVLSVNSQPLSDGASLHALRLLAPGLRAVRADAGNDAARLDCQVAAWLSVIGSQNGVAKGASHGIGHVLGGLAGVPHGYTSCVMLAHVLRFNRAVNAPRQAWVADALGCPGQDAADAVAALIGDLGLPARLRDVGVKAAQLDAIAEGSLHDRWVHTNPRKLTGAADVRALLDAAW
ncbi:MAG: iron-containing alcohol dehydrogenase [Rhodospirillales bacterium]|nr:iron-containing alcohol dehydrogenase [Rhodospirillales bacterium]